jgi:sigma-E factor negative regulatory protein RseC
VFAASRAFAVGDRVVLTLPERYVLLASLLLYGLPLAALVLGAAVGGAFSGSDAGAALGAAAAVAVSLLAAPRLRRRLERRTLERLEVVLGTPADAATHSL